MKIEEHCVCTFDAYGNPITQCMYHIAIKNHKKILLEALEDISRLENPYVDSPLLKYAITLAKNAIRQVEKT